MSDEASTQSAALPVPSASSEAHADGVGAQVKDVGVQPTPNNEVNETSATEGKDTSGSKDKRLPHEPTLTTATKEKVTTDMQDTQDTEMDNHTKGDAATTAVDGSADPATATPASSSKFKARRKSAGVPEHRSKKLNKKASKVKMSHADAKPGDYYFIRLKGYPLWPGIVCDESMLPQSLISSRPVTAARPDGTYRADYEDGGKKVHERTFPVMYLYTNEFGWIPNYDLVDLDLDEVGNVDAKMRKDLFQAHKLAAEKHDLAYFKQVLLDFQAARDADLDAKAAAKAAKEAIKASGKSKRKSKVGAEIEGEDNEDVEMADAGADLDVDGAASEKKPKSSKKRKAVTDPEESSTPQAGSSTKKLKFKPITSTPKAANGTTPKSSAKKDSVSKPSKSKSKKSAPNGTAEKVDTTPKEPEPGPEEKRAKKEKEILFLRHKLQKGLLTRDQQPKEEEMKQMSEFIGKLEGYADLEVSIIRTTKINKVLKAILKLEEIPKESEFQFKDRSKSLLEKWNKILESADQPAAKAVTNGISAALKAEGKDESSGDTEAKTDKSATAGDTNTAMPHVAAKEKPAVEAKAADGSIEPTAAEQVPVQAAS